MKAVERLEFQASLLIRGKESREELLSSGMIDRLQCRFANLLREDLAALRREYLAAGPGVPS